MQNINFDKLPIHKILDNLSENQENFKDYEATVTNLNITRDLIS